MKNLSTFTKLSIAALIIILLGYASYRFFGSQEPELVVTTENPFFETSAPSAPLIFQLQQISFNDAVFTREDYQRLRDFSVTITPQPVGRTNPFAPVGSSQGSTQPESGS